MIYLLPCSVTAFLPEFLGDGAGSGFPASWGMGDFNLPSLGPGLETAQEFMATMAIMVLVQLIYNLIHWIWCLPWDSGIVIYFGVKLTSVPCQGQDHSMLVLEFLIAAPQCRGL